MLNRFTSCLLAMLLGSCAVMHTKDTKPQILPTVSEQNKESNPYRIRVNFLICQSDIIRYPVITDAIKEALKAWCAVLPIEYVLFVKQDVSSIIISSDLMRMSNQPGIITVQILNLQGPPYGMKPGIVGFYDYDAHVLALDADSLECDIDVAQFVCLHELGHLFGLPHIVNEENLDALSGNIVLSKDLDAESFIMCCQLTNKNIAAKISDLEIAIAKQTILYLRRLPTESCFALTVR